MQVVDLFAGIGGLSEGWRAAGHSMLLAVERNPFCAATYQTNFPATTVFGTPGSEGNIRLVTVKSILRIGHPEVVVGGPPCQAFSVMGPRDPQDERRTLVAEFVRLACGLKPKYIVMENVPGILHARNISLFQEAKTAFENAKYRTTIWLIDSQDYGVPQRRRRVFLVASRGKRKLAMPTTAAKVNVADAIADLPASNDDGPWPVLPSTYATRMGAGVDSVTAHTFSHHRLETIARLRSLGFGDEDVSTGMRRLDPEGLAWTLRASSRTLTACRPVHPYQPRVITPREAARLSGFPDRFSLSENIAQSIADVGNAVPPPVSRAVADALYPQS